MIPALLVSALVAASPSAPQKVKRGDAAASFEVKVTGVVSETAQLFHVVDQLSAWSPYSHKHYREHFGASLTEEDTALLGRYAEVRRKLGHGPVEAALYTERSLDAALSEAVRSRALTEPDARVIGDTLRHFAPRASTLIAEREGDVNAYAQRVETILADESRGRRFARWASRFFGVKRLQVPVFVVASPGKGFGGGGYNGGRLVVEVGEGAKGDGPLLHELWHAFAEEKGEKLLAALKSAPGLDFETLSEGLAYAISPGLFAMDEGEGDWLAARVRKDLQERKSFLYDPYVRFNRLALALRPTLRQGLEEGSVTLESFLPIAVAQWRGLHALADAQERTHRGFFVFGEGEGELPMVIAQAGHDVWRRDLDPRQLEAFSPRFRAQDTVVIVLRGADAGRVPEPFRALFGSRWSEVQRVVGSAPRGSTRVRGTHGPVVLFWGAGEGGLGAQDGAWVLDEAPATALSHQP